MRNEFYLISAVTVLLVGGVGWLWPPALWVYLLVGPLVALGIYDVFQCEHAVLRNFPVIGHGRYIMEAIRPEIQQYFVERDTDENPISREMRAVVYQRAKGDLDTHPFGTQRDVYEPGAEWVCHSLEAKPPPDEEHRLEIGGPQCDEPYRASRFNISAMSYGALSKTAVLAMNKGAARGGFLHNTGEGGLTDYHLEYGADVAWQIGTGYFGCRTDDGGFDPKAFAEKASHDEVKMIELKLSQGAKPGHGGILPGDKVSEEIAEFRGVEPHEDVVSPPTHREFSTPVGMLEFIDEMRERSGGKPVGFKFCVGHPTEVMSICKAIDETGIYPDFITVDGKEGGTGAGPLEFVNSVGLPLDDALKYVHNALVGAEARQEIALLASSKILTGFDIFRAMALGADACNAARAMMFAVGCIQARRCNKNTCPTGVATQDPELYTGIDVEDKGERVWRYHRETIHSFLELVGAAGLDYADEIRPDHVMRRLDNRNVATFAQLNEHVEPGALHSGDAPESYQTAWESARADDFRPEIEPREERHPPSDLAAI